MANEHSQIVPSMQPTAKVADFKFWCQKVLPLVYDDSLSYYEVLNKMVVYLNQVIDNINADIDNVEELEDDFLLLQEYVNNFFDDIDQLATYAERAEAAETAALSSAASAAESASNSATSASNAASSASSSATSALSAMDAKDAAVAAKTAAETALASAQTAATNAAASATAASGSATNAATSATSAQQSFTLADAARTAAQTAATSAENDAETAADSAAEAIAAVDTVVNGLGNITKTINNTPLVSVDDALASLVKNLEIEINPVQSGSGDPAPDNIRAITGWTGANVTRCGVNILKPTIETWYEGTSRESNGVTFTWTTNHDGIIHASGTAGESHSTLNYSLIWLPKGQYKITGLPDPTSYSGQVAKPVCLRIGPNTIGGSPQQFLGNGDTFTVDSYSRWGFRLYIFNTATINADFKPMLIPIELYKDNMEYNPYSEDIYSFTFPNPPETVYGGYLNVTTGKLIPNGRLLTLQTGGTGTYAYNSSNGQLRITGFSAIENSTRNICSHYKSFRGPFASLPDKCFMASGGTIAIKDSSLTSLDAWMTYLDSQVTAGTPVQVVIQYTISTTTPTYELTPQEVIMLSGRNNIWADAGNINILEYFINAENYVTAQINLAKTLIAPVLNEMKADTALVANDFRIVGNVIYRITTNISSGGTLTPNTNCVATTVGEILKSLLNA